MIGATLKLKISGDPRLERQTTFALASTLTLTAKEIQTETIKALDKDQGGAFQIRTNWARPSNIYGVRVKPATKQKLESWVGTAADWLQKFIEKPEGSIVLKLPQGDFIAIPTSNVRRTKRDIIRATQRPRALKGKRDVLVPMKSGKGFLLFQERGRGASAKMVLLYLLVRSARIREKDVLFAPAKKVYLRRFGAIYEQQLRKALTPK